MKVKDYKKLYELVLKMSFDAEEFGLFDDISEDDIAKAKWIASIAECLNDVPIRRASHVFKQKRIKFDAAEFLN